MCYPISFNLEAEKIKSLLSRKVILNAENFTPGLHFQGFSKPYLSVVCTLNPDVLDFYRWPLIPSWVKDEKNFKAFLSGLIKKAPKGFFQDFSDSGSLTET
jgi:hypothetical protein